MHETSENQARDYLDHRTVAVAEGPWWTSACPTKDSPCALIPMSEEAARASKACLPDEWPWTPAITDPSQIYLEAAVRFTGNYDHPNGSAGWKTPVVEIGAIRICHAERGKGPGACGTWRTVDIPQTEALTCSG